MHLIIWEFAVREEHLEDCIRAYGANGDWAKLFRLAEGYLGTQLLRNFSRAWFKPESVLRAE